MSPEAWKHVKDFFEPDPDREVKDGFVKLKRCIKHLRATKGQLCVALPTLPTLHTPRHRSHSLWSFPVGLHQPARVCP